MSGFETWTSDIEATALPTEPQQLPGFTFFTLKTCIPSFTDCANLRLSVPIQMLNFSRWLEKISPPVSLTKRFFSFANGS